MDSRTGKQIRMGRLVDGKSGRTIILAYSHGLLLGPQPGMRTLDEMRAVVESCRRANGIMLSPGLVKPFEQAFVGPSRPSLVVHLDWTNFSRRVLPYDQGRQVSVATIEDVAAAGADAVMTYLLLGDDDPGREAEEIDRNARIARACERLGIVHMIEPRLSLERRHPERKLEPELMRLYCRMAAEVGADLIKCVWSGSVETMREIVESCPAPVLVAGGPRDDDHPDRGLQTARDALAAGCRGVVYGRTIYQSPDPEVALDRLRAIVHAPVVQQAGRA